MEMKSGSCRLGLWHVHVEWRKTTVHRVRFATNGHSGDVPELIRKFCAGQRVDLTRLRQHRPPRRHGLCTDLPCCAADPVREHGYVWRDCTGCRDQPPRGRAGHGPQPDTAGHTLPPGGGGGRDRGFLAIRGDQGRTARDGKERTAQTTIGQTDKIYLKLHQTGFAPSHDV